MIVEGHVFLCGSQGDHLILRQALKEQFTQQRPVCVQPSHSEAAAYDIEVPTLDELLLV